MARTSFVDVALRLRGARRFNAEVAAATKQLEAMGVKGAASMGAFAQKAGRFQSVGRSLTTGLTLPIAAVGGASVIAAAKWESAFAGVRKTVSATEPQLAKLDEQLRQMALEIPVSAVELANIAEAAGQLGIATPNIASFTRVMADLGEATNMTSTTAAEELARFANITQMPQSQFSRLGSTVVALGNSLAATESDIVGMGMRIAGAGNQIGLTESEIMSFAGALSSVGIRAEMGGTAISTAFLEANSAVISGGSELQKWAAIAGISASSFRAKWNANAGLAMTEFLEGLGRLSKGGVDVKARLEDLGLSGLRIRDVLMRASGAGDLLRESLGLGAEAWAENSALTREAQERYRTFQSRIQMVKNMIFETGIVVGQALIPPLLRLVEFVAPKIQAFARLFSNLPRPIKQAAIGAVLLAAVLGPAIWMLGSFARSVGALIIVLPKILAFTKALALRMAILNLAMSLNPVGLIVIGIVALIAAFVLAYHKIGWFRDAVDAVFGWLKGAVVSVIDFVRANWKMIAIALTGPVGIAVALIIKHWSKIKGAASAVVAFVTGKFRGLVAFFRGLPGAISGAVSGAFNGIKEAFRSAINFIIYGWNGLDLSLSVLGKTVTIGTPNIPALAEGGTVTRTGTVLVGERGPELLSLPRAASVIPLGDRMGPGRIEVPVYLNGRQIALAVAGEVANAKARA